MSNSPSLDDDNDVIDNDHMIGDVPNGNAEDAPQDDEATEPVQPVTDEWTKEYDNAVR